MTHGGQPSSVANGGDSRGDIPEGGPGARQFDLGRFLLARYVLVLPLFVAATSCIFYLVVRSQYVHDWERHAVDAAEDLNQDLVEALAGPNGELPEPDAWRRVGLIPRADAVARRTLRVADVVRINVFSRGGALVYSTAAGLAPRPARPNPKLEEALRGRPVSGVEFGRGEQDFDEGRHVADLMETYFPMRLPDARGRMTGAVVGAFEVYQDVTPMANGLRFLGGTVALGSVAVLALLGAVLVTVGRRAALAVRHERSALEDLTRRLEDLVAERTADLRQERETLASVLDGAPVAFALLDKDLRVLYVSRQFAILAATARPQPGAPIDCSGHWRPGDRCERCVAVQALSSGRAATQIRSLHDDHGEPRWLEHVAVPVKGHDAAVRIVEMVTDVTERRRHDERLARAGRLATAGEIAATVAHEVRNAATTTRLLLQLWREQGGPTSQDLGSIDVALVAVQRMETLVENLLRLTRPQPTFTLVDCRLLLRQAMDLVRADADRRRVQIVEDGTEGSAMCRGDPGLLTEAFVNLLLNGIQACDRSPPGLRRAVMARTSTTAGDGREGGGGGVLVEIADTGPGISSEAAPRLFEPFFTTRDSGTGLGLPIARRIVEGHGGTITVTNDAQGGVSARILLPLATVEAAA